MMTKVLLTFVATIVLYYTYKLLFGKCNRFEICRMTLLAMSVFAFVFPFISIEISKPLPEYFLTLDDIEILNNNNVNVETESVKNNSLSFLQIISLVYIIGVVISFVKIIFNIYKIRKIKMGKKQDIIDGFNVIYTSENHIPFSFFNNIFIPDNTNPLILKHEMSHVRHRHSLDIILMEIMISFQWFNPFIYKMKKELQGLHEYIADNETIENETDKSNYMMLLLQQCTADDYNAIANNFSFLLTKKRIIMITQKQKSKKMVIRMLLSLPVFALLILLNTQCENVKVNDKQTVNADNVINEVKHSNPTSVQNADVEVGNLSGCIYDTDTKKPLSGANVILSKNEEESYNTTSDNNGRYEFKSIPAGAYDLKAFYEGYKTITIKSIVIPAGKFAFQDLSLINGNVHKRENPSSKKYVEVSKDSIYTVTEEMPQFPGGPNELMKYLGENIKYPQSAIDNKIEGRVFVSFVIEKDGSVTNAEVLRGIDKNCDAEALRVVSSMPKWKPGINEDGDLVRCKFTVPVVFKLNNKE